MRWDIFCRVVDNYGDIGVSWRLSRQLAALGHDVRLWTDDASALAWMAAEGAAGVTVYATLDPATLDPATLGPGGGFTPGDVVVSAFGSEIVPSVVDAIALANANGTNRCCWIQLEYLSAEAFVAASHGLPSPVHGDVNRQIRKWFFFPGFTPDTGGLLREPDLAQRRARFNRQAWFQSLGIDWTGERIVSLFCYEPRPLARWLAQLGAGGSGRVRLLVTAGRATHASQAALAQMPVSWNAARAVQFTFLDHLSQDGFDQLLWASDCNFVRGEDSLVRALWAGAGFIWHIYPQSDGVHREKLLAFLDWLGAPASLREFHRAWNGMEDLPTAHAAGAGLPEIDFPGWRDAVERSRERLLAQDDLATRLLRFIAEKR